MWIILFNALDDFGVKELNAAINLPHNHVEIDVVRRKVADEALHGALRIAGLAGVLTSNGYLVSLRDKGISRAYRVINCPPTSDWIRPSCTSAAYSLAHCLPGSADQRCLTVSLA